LKISVPPTPPTAHRPLCLVARRGALVASYNHDPNPVTLEGSFMCKRLANLAVWVALLGVLTVVGCEDRKPIRSYTVVKDEPPPPPPAEPDKILWSLPQGWSAQRSSDGIAYAAITTDGDQPVRITVTQLPGGAGGMLANIQRWAGQIAFQPSEDEARQVIERRICRSGEYILVDMVGQKVDELTGQPLRILGSVMNDATSVWFFKAMAPADWIEPHKAAFTRLTDSVKFPGVEPEPRAATQPPPSIAAPPPGIAAPPQDNRPAGAPTWTVPDGWQPGPATAFAMASFVVEGDGQSAKTTVSQLGMPPGENVDDYLLINVNRWRRQVGLPAGDTVADAGVSPRQLGNVTAYVVDLVADAETADAPRILGVIIPQGRQAWFIKMTGPSALVETQKQPFTQFVQSMAF